MTEPSTEPVAGADNKKEKLAELCKTASLQYSIKNFSAAAEAYASAVEIQDEINGEMSMDNAELLFYYARALFKVAVAKSDVLGSKVAQEEEKKPRKKEKVMKEDVGEEAGASADGAKKAKDDATASKPYFQLTGDENWTDSEDEEEDEGDEAKEEEQDDFKDAFEIFEISKVLYNNKLETLQDNGESKGKGKAELSPEVRTIKEKIADCHGFLVEISLENERFHEAVSDARASLALQEELQPFDHENVTEGHYSLSLALEFASVSKVREQQSKQDPDAPDAETAEEDLIDFELRKEAAKHTERAIESLRARLEKEEAILASGTLTDAQKKEKVAIIEDKKSMLEDLKNRLADLESDPAKQKLEFDDTMVSGFINSLSGANPAEQKAKLAEAVSSANDVSGLVKARKKEKAPAAAAAPSSSDTGSKRKLEAAEDTTDGKRPKTEEPE